MGLPGSGKTFLAKALKQYLEDNGDLMKINPQRVLTYEGIPGSDPISVEPNLVLVCDSKTGSITFMLIAVTIDFRTSEASKPLL